MYREADVLKALERLAIEADLHGDELMARCPMHRARTGKPDFNPSWSMNASTGAHHCFSCGYKGSLISLVAEILDLRSNNGLLDYDAARDWLKTNTPVDLNFLAAQLEELKDAYVRPPSPVEMSEARLAVFSDPPGWALALRGFRLSDSRYYGIRWDKFTDSWVTPIRNPDSGKLMGWQEKGQRERRFFNRPAGVAKSKTLFGLDVWAPGTMVLVESPLDAPRLRAAGVVGGVACYGASISSEQIALMRRADKLIVALDNDPAGNTASLKLLEALRKQGMECWFFNYTDIAAKDVGDMSDAEIVAGVEGALHCVLGKKAVLQ